MPWHEACFHPLIASRCLFIYSFIFRRGAWIQSHEYKTWTAAAEVSGPGGEELLLLFHFKAVSLTDDFWAPSSLLFSLPPPTPHASPFSLYLWFKSVGITLQTVGGVSQTVRCFLVSFFSWWIMCMWSKVGHLLVKPSLWSLPGFCAPQKLHPK